MPPSNRGGRFKSWATVLFVAYSLFMLSITLLIFRGDRPLVNLVPFRTIVRDVTVGPRREFIVNFLGNIAAFVPLGFLHRRVFDRGETVLRATLFCAVFSAAIEGLQYVWARRVADVDDVILNTLGGAIGALIAQGFAKLPQRPGNSVTTIE